MLWQSFFATFQSLFLCQQAMARLLTDSIFCAGHSMAAAHACEGDSEGPFTVSHNTLFLLGAGSWAKAVPSKGNVYTPEYPTTAPGSKRWSKG